MVQRLPVLILSNGQSADNLEGELNRILVVARRDTSGAVEHDTHVKNGLYHAIVHLSRDGRYQAQHYCQHCELQGRARPPTRNVLALVPRALWTRLSRRSAGGLGLHGDG